MFPPLAGEFLSTAPLGKSWPTIMDLLFEKEDCNTRNEIRKSLSYSDKDIVFLYVGRISPEKGVLELVHAFEKLELANKKLLLVGCSYQ